MDKDITRATTHLPGLQVESVHQRPSDEVEQISIELQSEPSFEAFWPANLFAFWFRAAEIAWAPLGRISTNDDVVFDRRLDTAAA